MSIALPKPVAAYFAAEKRQDADALARCFVDDVAARKKYHHKDLFDFGAAEDLQRYDACFFCLGVSSAGIARPTTPA